MEEILKTNNPVTLSFAEALLKEASIAYTVLDGNMSVLEGSLGILPRRIVVDRDRAAWARTVLREAGLGDELAPVR